MQTHLGQLSKVPKLFSLAQCSPINSHNENSQHNSFTACDSDTNVFHMRQSVDTPDGPRDEPLLIGCYVDHHDIHGAIYGSRLTTNDQRPSRLVQNQEQDQVQADAGSPQLPNSALPPHSYPATFHTQQTHSNSMLTPQHRLPHAPRHIFQPMLIPPLHLAITIVLRVSSSACQQRSHSAAHDPALALGPLGGSSRQHAIMSLGLPLFPFHDLSSPSLTSPPFALG